MAALGPRLSQWSSRVGGKFHLLVCVVCVRISSGFFPDAAQCNKKKSGRGTNLAHYVSCIHKLSYEKKKKRTHVRQPIMKVHAWWIQNMTSPTVLMLQQDEMRPIGLTRVAADRGVLDVYPAYISHSMIWFRNLNYDFDTYHDSPELKV